MSATRQNPVKFDHLNLRHNLRKKCNYVIVNNI